MIQTLAEFAIKKSQKVILLKTFRLLVLEMQLTKTRQVSTRENVPDRPIPALQWTTAGPWSTPSEPDSRTLNRKLRKLAGDSGTPKSGHVV